MKSCTRWFYATSDRLTNAISCFLSFFVSFFWKWHKNSFPAFLSVKVAINEPFILFLYLIQIQLGCPYMQESSVDWIFKGPACLVLIINLIFLFSIMWVSLFLSSEIGMKMSNFSMKFFGREMYQMTLNLIFRCW